MAEPASVLVLASGRIGHEVNARGVAVALGLPFATRPVSPRFLFARLAPWGPVDPRERPDAPGSPIGAPWPDIAIASGRITVPYIRALKRASPRTFALFLQDPRWSRGVFDLIWTPEHDSLRGPDVITTLTSPHPFSPDRIAALRAAPDPRLTSLPAPRCAIVLGGPSGAQHFTTADLNAMAQATRAIAAQGFSIMATPSRRTPPALLGAVRAGLGSGPSFVWDGQGENPYAALLALADAILVTGDSANMVGEATATGAPVHIFEPSGGRSRKLARAIDALIARGAARRWNGRLERFSYTPINSSGEIAAEVLRRFRARAALVDSAADRVAPAGRIP